MATLFFPDNTVLINFAYLRRITTWELLRVARRVQFIDEDMLWSYVHVLAKYRRHQPPFPAARSRADFYSWLEG